MLKTCLKYKANGYGHNFGFANYLTLIVSFTSHGKWVQREKYPFKACKHVAENSTDVFQFPH